MVRVLFAFLIVIMIIAVVITAKRGGLVRGVAENMLVSPARPAIAVRPAASFHLINACRAEGLPRIMDGHLGAAGSNALFWYALYEGNGAKEEDQLPAHLVVMLGTIDDPYRWIADAGAPVPPGEQGTERALQRHAKYTLDGREVHAVTFLLDPEKDPWASIWTNGSANGMNAGVWNKGSVVRRFAFRLFQDKARLIVEYREPYGLLVHTGKQHGLRLVDNAAVLAAFEERAQSAYTLLDQQLPKPEQNLAYPPAGVGRKQLAAYAGEIRRLEGPR